MKKRILAVLLCVVLMLTAFSVVYAEGEDDVADITAISEDAEDTEDTALAEDVSEDDEKQVYAFEEVASNKNFSLAYDPGTTFIRLTDKRTGQEWYSNPPISVDDDPYVQGIAKTDIRSILHMTYTNASLKVKETNSYSASVMKNSADVKILKNGLRIDYNFKEMKITVPVQFTISEEGLKAEILFSEIKEESTNYVNNMDFLMYFGTAGENDKGYLVIPDGSGAIVNFNNNKNVDGMMYKKSVYGKDLATLTEAETRTSREETITLPVYGMVKNGYGFLAEITSGSEMATVKAAASGNRLVGAYNILYTNAVYRIYYEIPLMGQISTTVSNALYNAQDVVSNETYTVEFHFTDNDQTTYVELAGLYRDLLTKRGWLTKDAITDKFYAEFYGGVNKTKSFVGILYTARETLTSFNQAADILADLKAGGVDNISAMYVNYSDDFFARDAQIKLSPSNSLGGKSDLTSLLSYTKDNSIGMAMAADFVTLPSGGNGYSTFWDVADAINISPIEVYPFSLNSNIQNTAKKPYYLIDPQKYSTATDSLLNAITTYDYSALYFDDDAMELYSDLAPGGYQRERTVGAQREVMEKLSASAELTFSNPNAYLFEYADYMVNIPVCSSKSILFDEDIPFLQTVLRGMKNMAGESMNITDVSEKAFLQHLEFGTDMKYALMEADSEVLLTTDLTYLYSAKYETFKDQIKERYKAFAQLGEAVGDSTISAHSRSGDVAVTAYSNGAKVYVNYGDESATVDGVTIGAMDYVIQ